MLLLQAGLTVPRHFGNDAEAFRAAREGVALVDRSHWGRLRLTGEGRLRFLQGQACPRPPPLVHCNSSLSERVQGVPVIIDIICPRRDDNGNQ